MRCSATLEGHLDCRRVPARQRADPRRRGRGGRGRRARRARALGADRPGPRDRARDDRGGHPRAGRARVAGASILEDVVWRHRATKVAPEDGQPEALRGLDPQQHDHLRHRAGGHGQDVPGRGPGRRGAEPPRGQPDHPDPPGRRGRRAARLPARRPDGQGRPVPAAAVRRAARHARARARLPAPRARRDRGRAAGLHARAHAQRQLHHPRRGPEHEPRADEDVPHPARLQLEDGRHRRHHPDRPAARAGLGAGRRRRHPAVGRGDRVRPLRRGGRRPPQARAADRRRLQRARAADGARAAAAQAGA